MSRLYNANLDDRTCTEERYVGNDLPLEEFLTALREAAEGLENPTVEIDHEQFYDSCDYRIVVSGRRPLTDAEVAQEEHNRALMKARRGEYEQAELRLLARLSAEPTGRFSTSAPNDQSLPQRQAEKQPSSPSATAPAAFPTSSDARPRTETAPTGRTTSERHRAHLPGHPFLR